MRTCMHECVCVHGINGYIMGECGLEKGVAMPLGERSRKRNLFKKQQHKCRAILRRVGTGRLR